MRGMYFLLQSYSQVAIGNHQVANSSECRTIYILFYPLFCCFKKIDFQGDFADPTIEIFSVDSFSPINGLIDETEGVMIKYHGSNKSNQKRRCYFQFEVFKRRVIMKLKY